MAEFRILVADDEPRIRSFLRRGLSLEGYDVLEAHSGAAAVELTQTAKPDLIILDWMMPGIDGPEALRQIRKAGSLVPILFMTGRDGADQDGLLLGANAYFHKPVEFLFLLEKLKFFLPSKIILA